MNQETEKYLSELEQLTDEATKEPWVVFYGEEFGRTICHRIADVVIKDHGKCYSGNPKDCKFIVAAREAVPRLINMVRELDAEADLLADDLAYEGDYCPLDADQCPKVSCTQEQRGKCWRIAAKQWIKDDDVEEENARSDNV